MKENTLTNSAAIELLYQALETEKGGVQIYSTALRCATDKRLKAEWDKYLEQTKNHVQVVSQVLKALNLDPETETPGRKAVRLIGTALVKTMELVLRQGDMQTAQVVAAECVTLAETKDHLNWELIGKVASSQPSEVAAILKQAYDKVEDEEDEHLYHTAGWARELWIQALGMEAVLPPPEERKHVKTASGAATAKKTRTAKA